MFLKRCCGFVFLVLFSVPVGAEDAIDLKSVYNLGPALSKVYQVPEGAVSLGAYAELYYINFADSSPSQNRDIMNAFRFVPIIGYNFSDKIVANAELEIEHGMVSGTAAPGNISGRGGYVAIEFLYLDFLLSKEINLRAGSMLVPSGLVNEIHEPPTFNGVLRPEVEREIIPSTWYDVGVGIHGEMKDLSYRAYLLNGPDVALFTDGSGGIKSMRQRGARAISEDFATVMRVDYDFGNSFSLGGSVYHGQADQQRLTDGDVVITLYDIHSTADLFGFNIKALYAQTEIYGADKINKFRGISGSTGTAVLQAGGYFEVARNILPLFVETHQQLSAFARFEFYDTHKEVPQGYVKNPAYDRTTLTLGLTYKPENKVVVKTDYSFRDDARDNSVGKPSDLFNLGIGFMF